MSVLSLSLSHLDKTNRIIAAQFLRRHLKWPPHWVEGVLDHLNIATIT